MSVRQRLERLTAGAPAGPLLVLFGLNFVDEFDRWAFAALTPEIRDAFGLSDVGIGAIAVISGATILLAALPIGVVADRANRVRFATGAAILWGSMTVLTGLVPSVALLFLVRLLAGIGRITNEVVHPSLLNDYYPPQTLHRIFFVHRLANPISGLAGVIAGVVADAWSWEWAFFLLAIPTFVLVPLAARLREPLRGATIDAELASRAVADAPIGWGEARRRLYAVATLRRLWGGALFLGVAIVSTPALLSLFFEKEHGFSATQRGVVAFLYALGTVGGFFLGLWWAERAEAAGDTPRLAVITGFGGVWLGGGFLLMAIVPWAPAAMVVMTVAALGTGALNPAYFPLVGRVSPPALRSQAYAIAIVWLAVGALASLVLFGLGESEGYRAVMVVLAASLAIAGLVARSARRFVRGDVDSAEAALALSARQHGPSGDSASGALLTCRGVAVAYDQVQVLFGVDIEVREGEIVALLGTNGAGKSTLLRAISGLTEPSAGSIFLGPDDITHADAQRTSSLGIIQVPGGRAIFPTLTVAEHLRLATWHHDEQAAVERTHTALGLFPVLGKRTTTMAGNLSGGEQQMLALSMAMIQQPRLLLIDELSLGLAPIVVEELLEAVERIRDGGTAVILVEQSVNLALTIADRAYFMEKGEIRFDGATADLLGRDDLLRSVFLEGASKASDGRPARSSRSSGSTAATVSTPPSPAAPERNGHALAVRGISRSFGGVVALQQVDLEVAPAEILGIIGPNGAGKTTLFDVISGHVRADTGDVLLGDRAVTDLPPHRRSALGLGRSFQDARLFPSLTVAENLALGLERHLRHRDHVAATLGLPAVIEQEVDVAWTVNDLVELMGLGAYRSKLVRELSTGTRRIVELAMVSAHGPDVLLLDEPSSGIAQREAEALGPLLRDLRDEVGCAMLVIEHDVPLVTDLSDRMVAMDIGRPIAVGSPQDVIRDPHVVTSYLGGDVAAIQRSGTIS